MTIHIYVINILISKINGKIKLNPEDLIIRMNSFSKKVNNLLFGKQHIYITDLEMTFAIK
jgi:hypothetical protein